MRSIFLVALLASATTAVKLQLGAPMQKPAMTTSPTLQDDPLGSSVVKPEVKQGIPAATNSEPNVADPAPTTEDSSQPEAKDAEKAKNADKAAENIVKVKEDIKAEAKKQLSTSACKEKAPKILKDAVCYDGAWIESEDLANPDFWDCGVKPLDIENAQCNHEAGIWEALAHDAVEDHATCGDLPVSKDFLVCNYESKTWIKFHAPSEDCFKDCGSKPAKTGTTMCNHESKKWEVIGAVNAPQPHKSPCGDKEKGMSDKVVCDEKTKKWSESDQQVEAPIPAAAIKTCEGSPPNVKFPACNVATGKWYALAADDESKILNESEVSPQPDTTKADKTQESTAHTKELAQEDSGVPADAPAAEKPAADAPAADKPATDAPAAAAPADDKPTAADAPAANKPAAADASAADKPATFATATDAPEKLVATPSIDTSIDTLVKEVKKADAKESTPMAIVNTVKDKMNQHNAVDNEPRIVIVEECEADKKDEEKPKKQKKVKKHVEKKRPSNDEGELQKAVLKALKDPKAIAKLLPPAPPVAAPAPAPAAPAPAPVAPAPAPVAAPAPAPVVPAPAPVQSPEEIVQAIDAAPISETIPVDAVTTPPAGAVIIAASAIDPTLAVGALHLTTAPVVNAAPVAEATPAPPTTVPVVNAAPAAEAASAPPATVPVVNTAPIVTAAPAPPATTPVVNAAPAAEAASAPPATVPVFSAAPAAEAASAPPATAPVVNAAPAATAALAPTTAPLPTVPVAAAGKLTLAQLLRNKNQ